MATDSTTTEYYRKLLISYLSNYDRELQLGDPAQFYNYCDGRLAIEWFAPDPEYPEYCDGCKQDIDSPAICMELHKHGLIFVDRILFCANCIQ